MLLTLDIETLPCEAPEVVADIAAGIKPPGSMKKAETIAKWEVDEKPAAIEEAVKKTSFDGTYGRILCIGWGVDDEEPESIIGSEETVLSGFMEALKARDIPAHGHNVEQAPVFIGHNLSGFDLRFLFQRCVINRIRPSMRQRLRG